MAHRQGFLGLQQRTVDRNVNRYGDAYETADNHHRDGGHGFGTEILSRAFREGRFQLENSWFDCKYLNVVRRDYEIRTDHI